MGPCLFLPYHFSCLSHRKTRWTMWMHLLDLKNIYFGDLNLHGPSGIFPLV